MSRTRSLPVAIAGIVAIVAGLASVANAETTRTAATKPAITPPAAIAKRQKLQACVDISYPPAEYYASNGSTPLGTDINMGQEIAKLFGVKIQWVKTPFSSIIAALQTKKCDVIISAITDTPVRRKQVSFVDYLKVNSAFLVAPGNPKNIHSVGDLCGKSIAMITGENWKPFLDKQNATCSTNGQGGVTITEFNAFADELQQLGLGRVDAVATSTVNGAYIVAQPANKGKVELASPNVPYTTGAWGMAVTKQNTALRAALVKAVRQLNKSGVMRRIFVKNAVAAAYVPANP